MKGLASRQTPVKHLRSSSLLAAALLGQPLVFSSIQLHLPKNIAEIQVSYGIVLIAINTAKERLICARW